jgi:hypothetical protein
MPNLSDIRIEFRKSLVFDACLVRDSESFTYSGTSLG